MKTAEVVKIFLLGMIAAFLAMIALRPEQSVVRADSGVKSGDVIAVTAPDRATLFLIDTSSKQIAQYGVDTNRFSLRAARHYGYDLSIEEATSPQGMDLKEAKKKAQETTKGGNK
jgi:hypothetical protein